MGSMILAASKSSSGSNPAFTFIILAVLVGLFYVLIMRPQRNRQRKAMQTQSQVLPGQRIHTTAGMYGTVVSGDERDVVIEISPGVQVTMLRRAIMEVVNDDPSTGAGMPSHEDIDPAEAEQPAADAEYNTGADFATGATYENGAEPGQATSTDEYGDLKDRNL